MEIQISLDVYKALTARLAYEGQTYDDVIRELLQLDSPLEAEELQTPLGQALEGFSAGFIRSTDPTSFHSRGLRLPHGTVLRARYKGKLHSARIEDGDWVSEGGGTFQSPSAAATAITENSVNGLRFWEALRPGDKEWRRLDVLVRS